MFNTKSDIALGYIVVCGKTLKISTSNQNLFPKLFLYLVFYKKIFSIY